MKSVLLADDEFLIREKLRNLVDWEDWGFERVMEAEDGEAAWECARKDPPDLVITDIRMPFMDGLELIKRLKTLPAQPDIILLSGYNDFSYAREALRLQVRDYLLKPIDATELETLLERLRGEERSHVESEEFSLESWLERELPLKREKEQLKALLEYRTIRIGPICAGLGRLPLPEGLTPWLRDGWILRGEQHWLGLFSHAEREGLKPEEGADSGGWSRSIAISNGSAGSETDTTGTGEQLFRLCREAASAFKVQRLWNLPGSLSWDELGRAKKAFSSYELSSDWSTQADCLLRRDEEGATELARMITTELSGSPLPYEDTTLALSHLFHFLAGQVEQREQWFVHPGTLLRECRGPEELRDRLESFFRGYRLCLEQKGERISRQILRAREYMDSNYANTGLSLEIIAEHSCLTPAYFSSLFKKEMGVSVVEYLTGRRLERARELMASGIRDLSEIAGKAGYSDPYYLSKCFKKQYGQSPSEYIRSFRSP